MAEKIDVAGVIRRAARRLGIDAADLGTAVSYETAGTFDPWKKGPTTKWGTHRGLIQYGEPQAKKYGVSATATEQQHEDALVNYLKDTGVQPGHGLLDIYSAINAGAVGKYNASDAAAGGAWGTVADKVKYQMAAHRRKALELLGMSPKQRNEIMKVGTTGPQVAGLQKMLTDIGLDPGPIDGEFGPKTALAVRQLQSAMNADMEKAGLKPIKADGQWGPRTKAATVALGITDIPDNSLEARDEAAALRTPPRPPEPAPYGRVANAYQAFEANRARALGALPGGRPPAVASQPVGRSTPAARKSAGLFSPSPGQRGIGADYARDPTVIPQAIKRAFDNVVGDPNVRPPPASSLYSRPSGQRGIGSDFAQSGYGSAKAADAPGSALKTALETAAERRRTADTAERAIARSSPSRSSGGGIGSDMVASRSAPSSVATNSAPKQISRTPSRSSGGGIGSDSARAPASSSPARSVPSAVANGALSRTPVKLTSVATQYSRPTATSTASATKVASLGGYTPSAGIEEDRLTRAQPYGPVPQMGTIKPATPAAVTQPQAPAQGLYAVPTPAVKAPSMLAPLQTRFIAAPRQQVSASDMVRQAGGANGGFTAGGASGGFYVQNSDRVQPGSRATYGRTGSDGVTRGTTSSGGGWSSSGGGATVSAGGRTYSRNSRGGYSLNVGRK